MENLPQTKLDLLRQLHDAARELDAVLDPLTVEQLEHLRDQGGWSILDHLNHLADWETFAAMLLEHRSLTERFTSMGVDETIAMHASEDEQNAMLRLRTMHRTSPETQDALRSAHERLMRAIEPLTDADLRKDYSEYQPEKWGGGNGKPVINWVVGNSSGHYREHLPWIEDIAAQGRKSSGIADHKE